MRISIQFYIFFFLIISLQTIAKSSNTVLAKSDSVKYYLKITEKLNQEYDFNKALQYAEKAKNYAFRNSKNAEIAETYYIIGSIHLNQKDYEKAETLLQRAASIAQKFNKDIEGLAHYKLGIVYTELKKYEKAEKHLLLSQEAFDKNGTLNNKNVKIALIEKGNLYEKLGKIDEAKETYKEIISQNELTKHSIEAYVNLANIIPKDSLKWTISQLKNIENDSENLDKESKIALYSALADLLLKDEAPYLANYYLKKYIEEVKNRDRLSVNPTIPFVDLTNDDNSSPNSSSDKALQFTKLISIMSIALIAILSLLSLSLYRNNKDRMRANDLLQNKNHELEIEKNKAEKASKARAEFLSTVSHELRTPLNAINGITHILLEENPNENQLQYLKSLEFSGDYLLRFINDILEINRVESGNVELEEINYDLRQLLENILESFSELSKKNQVVCKLEIDNQIPPLLIGDPTKISQVFMNLIGNAMKFSSQGNIWITVKCHNVSPRDVELYMEVRDSGIGISEDKQKSIFDSFTQGSVEINRKYGGTGLGLAIVKSLIQLLGGQIQLESKLNEGSKFFFTITQKIGEKPELIPIEVIYDETILENKHVLIVEDNKINQMITQKMLSKKKMTHVTIDNGEDAVITAKNEKFELILMDIHLPGINGTIAAEEIRKFDAKTPIIALTAISLDENREQLLSYGMNEVITKPFNPEKFYETIAATLHKTATDS